jgi:A/G-specific adenine glycosylase
VLVSEIMLQQTQASRVAPIFEEFLRVFPSIRVLADASRADVVRAWGGLGYHRRTAALHESAREIVLRHGGRIPRDPETLRTLPGVGGYTAAAVASIAYGEPFAAVDTNVRRIWARAVHGVEPDEVPAAVLGADAQRWLDRRDPAAWNQAMMDLGRTVCRPTPRCEDCPFRGWCRFVAAGATHRPSAGAPNRISTRRQAPFEGSLRQVRGAVVARLRLRSPQTLHSLAASAGFEPSRIVRALEGLVHDRVVDASAAALRGSARGRVALSDRRWDRGDPGAGY